ncbi:MAG: hypothetical protein ACUVXA_00130 [Candidatus Jordarchaeum sp.]|uniref:hypothetical protein n=1 Tax=Candidatus Jordarchaeum sp. TaxID=2823881 RepID=UPI0040493498
MKAFENKCCAIRVHFEWGNLTDLSYDRRRNNRNICKGFIRNRERLNQYKHIKRILREVEKWLQEWDRNKKLRFLPPPNLVPPI